MSKKNKLFLPAETRKFFSLGNRSENLYHPDPDWILYIVIDEDYSDRYSSTS